MEDFKIILYILLGIAYLIFTYMRKAFKSADEADMPEDKRYTDKGKPLKQPQRPPQPATSFEDILRELQQKPAQARAKGEELVTTVKETVRQELAPAPAAPVITYNQPKTRELSWEKPAQAREAQRRSQLLRESSFKAYDLPKPKPQRYKELLHNPSSVREAFILSEIFKRKYE